MSAIRSCSQVIFKTPLRRFIAGTILVVFALLALRFEVLTNPPYWDAAQGPFAEAIWLKHNGFDYWGLLTREPCFLRGGQAVYIWSVLPSVYALLYMVLPSPLAVFVVLHLTSFVLTGVTIATVDLILHRRFHAPAPVSLMAALLILTQPTFGGQVDAISMEIPTACAVTLLAVLAVGRRWVLLGVATTAALFIKDAITIVAVANLVLVIFSIATGTIKGKTIGWALGANLLPLLVRFGIVAAIKHIRLSHGLSNIGRESFGILNGVERLWRTVTRAYPELYVLWLAAVLAFVVATLRKSKTNGVRALGNDTVWVSTFYCLTVVGGYVLFQTFFLSLPRYITWFVPVLITGFMGSIVLLQSEGRRLVHAAVVTVIVFQALNTYDALRPAFPSTSPALAGEWMERSRIYLDDLEMDQEVAEYLKKNSGDRWVVVARLHALQFSLPELGYVDEALKLAAEPPVSFRQIQSYRELTLQEKRNVWIYYKPNNQYKPVDVSKLPPGVPCHV